MANAGDDIGLFGVLEDGRFVFTCANCGGVAATLQVNLEDVEVDAGHLPDGTPFRWHPGRPSFVLDFLGITVGVLPGRLAALAAGAASLDPLAVREIDQDLAGFCCVACRLNYCRDCWSSWMEFDEGFYDCTRGLCPQGHEQMLDD